MRYTFGKRPRGNEGSSAIDYPLSSHKDQERITLSKKKIQSLVLVLGPDEQGKIMLLNNAQWHQDPTQYARRQQLYRSRIVTRTCREFQLLLNILQADIDLYEFEEIRQEVQTVLRCKPFDEPSQVTTGVLKAIQALCQHYVIQQQMFSCASELRPSSDD